MKVSSGCGDSCSRSKWQPGSRGGRPQHVNFCGRDQHGIPKIRFGEDYSISYFSKMVDTIIILVLSPSRGLLCCSAWPRERGGIGLVWRKQSVLWGTFGGAVMTWSWLARRLSACLLCQEVIIRATAVRPNNIYTHFHTSDTSVSYQSALSWACAVHILEPSALYPNGIGV
jgi:hypothetical protein